jgi:type II secretory pathway pseudopilin PulG
MKSAIIQNTNKKDTDLGFSLIETAIALTTLGVCLAYAMPLFLYAKINNSKSEIRTGALIVSQRVFDDIRSRPFSTTAVNGMPIADGTTRDPGDSNDPNSAKNYWIKKTDTSWITTDNPGGLNPVVMPRNLNTIGADEKLLTFAMGRQYRTKVTYCPGVDAENTVCTTNSRKFKVEVSFNGSKVYDLEGNYTNFQ